MSFAKSSLIIFPILAPELEYYTVLLPRVYWFLFFITIPITIYFPISLKFFAKLNIFLIALAIYTFFIHQGISLQSIFLISQPLADILIFHNYLSFP